MNRKLFQTLLERRPLLLDGATGTELFKRGLPPGMAPEDWVIANPRAIQQLQREYFEAGSDIVLACAFGANRIKLADQGLSGKVHDMNVRLAEISREIVPDGRFLFGDMSPTGQLVEPFGPLPFEEAVAVFREQTRALIEGGVDGFLIETMMDVQEARAALIGVREAAPDLPVCVGMTFDNKGRTLGGALPEAVLVTLQSLGADAVGCNCSTGPDEMLPLLERMLPYAKVPLLVKPNAGMPCVRHGRDHYELGPEEFSRSVMQSVRAGARIVGGCCGTGPEHIRAVRRLLDNESVPRRARSEPRAALSSARTIVDLADCEGRRPRLLVIGERINPTGKKAFQAELLAGDLGRVLTFAEEQIAAGADLLDVNLGLGGIDETAAMRQAVSMLAPVAPVPLVIDTVNPEAMEKALRLYPGRALVNSVSGEESRLEGILPVAAEYGAMIIVLPVGEGFIPTAARERMEVAGDIIARAELHGLTRDDMLVDGLAMTVSADPAAGLAALEFIGDCAAAGLRTILGLSNVSFGMPERKWLNGIFLAMGMARGLSAVIANPSAEVLMEAKAAADALLNRHEGAAVYIERFANAPKAESAAPASRPVAKAKKADAEPEPHTPAEHAARAVLKGNAKQAGDLAAKAVASGVGAGRLVAEHLVPAIMKAGEHFEKGVYYLPQLMLAGEAMRLALAAIEADLSRERQSGAADAQTHGRIVMATVKGDVHDIGKNLVTLMLRNHGFEVFDLGKDVPASEVIRAAKENRADIVGLSALMTTTLGAMRSTIEAARSELPGVKFMVGGAAVTPHFAREAGADGFAPDAVLAVKLAEELMGKTL